MGVGSAFRLPDFRAFAGNTDPSVPALSASFFRPSSDSVPRAPFPSWSYKPSYLPAGLSIDVASGINLTEPLLFYLPFVRRRGPLHPEPTIHPAQIREIAAVALSLPNPSELSTGLQSLVAAGFLRIREARDYLLEPMFLGDRATPIDLRPHLPLLFVPQSAAA